MPDSSMPQKLGKFTDRWITRYGFWVAVGGTGVVSAKFAAASAWLDKWGPIGWWSAFLLGCILAAVAFAIVTWTRGRWLRDRELRKIVASSGVNPLSDRFERQTINVMDFYNRDYVAHMNKSFRDCYIAGPALVLLDGCTLDGIDIRHCQIIIHPDEGTLFGATAFTRCLFAGGVFSNITMMMNLATYQSLPADIRRDIPLASRGVA